MLDRIGYLAAAVEVRMPERPLPPLGEPVKIAAGICTWQDGRALEACCASLRGAVDQLLLADGLIDGVDPQGLLPLTPLEQLQWAAGLSGAPFEIEQRRWPSQSKQRDWTLQTARRLGCDWLLVIDADEQLANPQQLRPWLQAWQFDAFPIPFYFDDRSQAAPAAFKCLHVPHWRRYVCQGNMLENLRGETVQVIGQNRWADALAEKMPQLRHRPELRPEGRRSLRLSELEVQLEPYPPDVKVWLEPVYAPALLRPGSLEQAAADGTPLWYCPGCGRRYAGPGSCTAQHPPIGLESFQVAAA